MTNIKLLNENIRIAKKDYIAKKERANIFYKIEFSNPRTNLRFIDSTDLLKVAIVDPFLVYNTNVLVAFSPLRLQYIRSSFIYNFFTKRNIHLFEMIGIAKLTLSIIMNLTFFSTKKTW